MPDEPELLPCVGCDARFYVVWAYAIETMGGPEYCPFCGMEMDYKSARDQAEGEGR